MEKTLAMIKPHGIEMYKEVIRDLEVSMGTKATKTHATYVSSVPREVWDSFYPSTYLQKFPEWKLLMKEYFYNQPAFVTVYEGEGIIKLVRDLIGPTKVQDNPMTTLRGKWGRILQERNNGPLLLSNGEEVYGNVIHATDDKGGKKPEEFAREFNAFKRYLI